VSKKSITLPRHLTLIQHEGRKSLQAKTRKKMEGNQEKKVAALRKKRVGVYLRRKECQQGKRPGKSMNRLGKETFPTVKKFPLCRERNDDPVKGPLSIKKSHTGATRLPRKRPPSKAPLFRSGLNGQTENSQKKKNVTPENKWRSRKKKKKPLFPKRVRERKNRERTSDLFVKKQSPEPSKRVRKGKGGGKEKFQKVTNRPAEKKKEGSLKGVKRGRGEPPRKVNRWCLTEGRLTRM